MKVKGVIESGKGQGTFFTSLDWVTTQFERHMGFKPYPGTLNVRICPEDVPQLDELLRAEDFQLVPVDPSFCTGRVKKLRINGIPVAAVFPSENVRIHGGDILEIMGERNLKQALNAADGSKVVITDD